MRIGMNAPWMIMYNLIDAFFKEDANVGVVYSDEQKTVTLYVTNQAKAEALDILLQHEHVYGDVTLTVKVRLISDTRTIAVTSEKENYDLHDIGKLYQAALVKNPMYETAVEMPNAILGGFIYILFSKSPVSVYTDELTKYNGYRVYLPETIAEKIFVPRAGVGFSTDVSTIADIQHRLAPLIKGLL